MEKAVQPNAKFARRDPQGPRPPLRRVLEGRTPFARELTERRLALELTQKEVAQRAGIPPESLSAYEVGILRPGQVSMLKIKGALGWPLTEEEQAQLDALAERLRIVQAQQDELGAYHVSPPSPPKAPRVRRYQPNNGR